MKCRPDVQKDRCALHFSDRLTIHHAARLKETLSDQLVAHKTLEVNLDQVEEIDLSGVQLFCSANMDALQTGRTVTLQGEVPPVIAAAILEIGYNTDLQCVESPCGKCFWKGES